ncbi:MAG: 30S ribosomal protein S8 [bacterium]|nr:30S ribosomal protein S8 [bacterium]
MPVTDPISDMLTSIRNAYMANKSHLSVSASTLKADIIEILKKEGFVQDYKVEANNSHKIIEIDLRYDKKEPMVRGLERVSKPGLRIYVPASKIPRVKRGSGIAILSTSEGIMTDKECRRKKIGGEVICYAW